MDILSKILVGFSAFLHLGFLYLEMFLWKTPKGIKIFRLEPEFAQKSAVLAANQGLYNGFLAAGLIWSLCTTNAEMSYQLKLFFLACVIVAGIYGAFTASKNILYLQAVPGILAMIAVVFVK